MAHRVANETLTAAATQETRASALDRLPEAVRRQMIAAHCAALCAWLNRIATEGEQREEGSPGKTRTTS